MLVQHHALQLLQRILGAAAGHEGHEASEATAQAALLLTRPQHLDAGDGAELAEQQLQRLLVHAVCQVANV
jgi:hypothetical protein